MKTTKLLLPVYENNKIAIYKSYYIVPFFRDKAGAKLVHSGIVGRNFRMAPFVYTPCYAHECSVL